ncbi:hypothetical protein [Blastococcus sp. TF02A-26]|uniref:hypothetical protein n=1 Tax=Blastococcus sp. TF02A-26 TaxID=2250577 RepID=UPI0013143164|nr:hypothetical protein [Blastococcus sp. TF02A-26]
MTAPVAERTREARRRIVQVQLERLRHRAGGSGPAARDAAARAARLARLLDEQR